MSELEAKPKPTQPEPTKEKEDKGKDEDVEQLVCLERKKNNCFVIGLAALWSHSCLCNPLFLVLINFPLV